MANLKTEVMDEPSTDDLDCMPLIKRRRLLLSDKPPSSSSGASPVRHVEIASKRVSPGVLQEWQGLPKGVKFEPSDEELLWHLLAKVGKGEAEPHPLISEFIISLDEYDGFGYFHPQNLPGVKQDGSMSYFFHRTFKTISSRSRRKHLKIHNGESGDVRWHNIGKTKPVIIDGIHQGFKKMMVLYMGVKKGEKPEKTNWVMHQYHLGTEEDEGEVVASKIFYQRKSRKSDKNVEDLPLESVEAVVAEAEVVVSPVTEGLETHAGWAKLDNHYNYAKEDSENGENEHRVLLNSQHRVEDIIASGKLCQTQSYNESEDERNKSCVFDDVLDASSRLSVNLEDHLNECIPGGVPGKLYDVDSQFPAEICFADSAPETATVKVLDTSSFESPDSVITGVGVQHGYMIANSQPYSSTSSNFLVHVKVEPLEEDFLNSRSDTDAAMQSSAGILGSTDARCFSEAIISQDNILSKTSKTHESEESNHKCSNEVKAEPLEESCTKSTPETSSGKRWTDKNQVFDSVLSTFPVEVKVELPEDTYAYGVPESIACKLSSVSLENSSTVAQCKASNFHDDLSSSGGNVQENVAANCPLSHQPFPTEDEHLNSNGGKLSSTTVLDSICSQDNISLASGNSKKETENICHDQLSFPEKVQFDATDKFQNSISTNCQVMVKFEPLENDSLIPCKNPPSGFHDLNTLRAEVKGEILDELSDLIDHIPLKERIEMLHSGYVSNLDYGNYLKCHQQTALRASRRDSVTSVNTFDAEARRLSVRRKLKKTATNSVETALEEDIPGLLQVLLDKGITIDEIKLYGDKEDDVALEISCTDDSFEDLETVINKLYFERTSLFKLNLLRHTRGSNAVYCLSCLISLIEQTRYLQFRNTPVEWGWCRDLQSFIFVFERHNRIVLERPEYAYATYFFELVGSLPVDWQIKRLVTVMKLTNCSRTTLIENRALLVGEDLSDGEARVLEDYGWTRNSGLGSLLNYCDRVVHDRRNEMDSSYWRAKIGKLLMDGHDGGCTVVANPPKKVVEYMGSQNPSIKLEI